MKVRDAHGRFRKRTAEERWPDPRERKIATDMREMVDAMKPMWAQMALRWLRDVDIYTRRVW